MTTKIGNAANYLDLLLQIGAALAVGSAFAKTYAGTGTGDIALGYVGGPASVAETFTITATDATHFSVVGSTSGNIGVATVGVAFATPQLNFTIAAGATAFSAGDVFTLNTAPAWTRRRWGGRNSDSQVFGTWANALNAFDPSTVTAATGTLPANLGIHFPTAIAVREVSITIGQSGSEGPKNFSLQYSDDGAVWQQAQAFNADPWNVSNERRKFQVAVDPGAHLHWRLQITSVQSGGVCTMYDVGMHPAFNSAQDYTKRFEAVWQAPGNADDDEINVQAFTYENPSNGCYNFGLHGSASFTDTLAIENQVSPSGTRTVSLWQSATPFWLVYSGSRFIVGARVSTIYTAFSMGYIKPWTTPDRYPRPLMIAGTSSDITRPWNNRSPDHRTLNDPGRYGVMVMWPDGLWREVVNRYDSGSGDDGQAANVGRAMWPASYDLTGNIRNDIRENLDGSFPLAACAITATSPRGSLGELDGVYWTPGQNNAPERIERQGGFDHIVLANIYRAQTQHFFAIRLD